MKTLLDLLWKLALLPRFLKSGYCSWTTEIWRRDPDERYCCDGAMCCCGGIALREAYRAQQPQGGEDE